MKKRTYEEMHGNEKAKLLKENLSKRMKKNNPINIKGVKEKISKANKGRLIGDKNPAKRPEVRKKISEFHKGKPKTLEHKNKLSIVQSGKKYSAETNMKKGSPLEKNGRWLGGKSFEPYSPEFNKILKKQIKERDNYKCQICNNKGLSIHHIDYNKKNNHENNLICLCNSCHAKTNSNRIYHEWQFKVFMNLFHNANYKFNMNYKGGFI